MGQERTGLSFFLLRPDSLLWRRRGLLHSDEERLERCGALRPGGGLAAGAHTRVANEGVEGCGAELGWLRAARLHARVLDEVSKSDALRAARVSERRRKAAERAFVAFVLLVSESLLDAPWPAAGEGGATTQERWRPALAS